MNKPLLDLFHKKIAQQNTSLNPTKDLNDAIKLIEGVIARFRVDQMATQQAQVQGDTGSVQVSGSQVPQTLQQAMQLCQEAAGQIGSLEAMRDESGQPMGVV